MKKSEFVKESKRIEKEMEALRKKQDAAEKKYLATFPYKDGDKVKTKSRWGGREIVGFIKGMHSDENGHVSFDLLQAKKDGTSGVNRCGYCINLNEIIERVN